MTDVLEYGSTCSLCCALTNCESWERSLERRRSSGRVWTTLRARDSRLGKSYASRRTTCSTTSCCQDSTGKAMACTALVLHLTRTATGLLLSSAPLWTCLPALVDQLCRWNTQAWIEPLAVLSWLSWYYVSTTVQCALLLMVG